MVNTPLGAKGATAEAAIARVCVDDLAPLELLERVAIRLRRAVPYDASCWKPMDPRTLLFTGFGIEDRRPGTLAAVRWRFLDNELLEPDFAKYRELVRRRIPVTTLHRETHGEPERSARYRHIHRALGYGAELRAAFRSGEDCWGSVALVRDASAPDFSSEEIAFVGRVGPHLAHGLRQALLREAASEGTPERAPGVIVLEPDGSIRFLTEQAEFWLERFPADRGTALDLPASVHAVARRALAGSPPSRTQVSVRLTSGEWLTVHAACLRSDGSDASAVAVTLAPAAATDLLPLRLRLYGLTPREREVAQLLTRAAANDEIARTLVISRHTVKDHVKAVFAKVGVASRAELSAKLFYERVVPRLDSRRAREFALAPAAG